MRMLLAIVAWPAISFLFTLLWGAVISRADDHQPPVVGLRNGAPR